jgi:Cu+-exporting ATPase
MKLLFVSRIALYVGALSVLGTAAFAQAPAKKSAVVSPVYCAVTGEKIGDPKNAAASKVVNGKTYYVCCPGCAPKFDAAPAKYAKVADLQSEKRNLQAKIQLINAELKKVEGAPATQAATPKEEKTSVASSSSLHCAITDEAIASAKDAAGSEVFNGKTYYFCCPGCVTKFKADPAKYAAEADKRDAARVNK